MKILWVKGGKLWPVDTGGKIRSFNILRHLARHYEVTLLSYYGGPRDRAYESAIVERLPQTQIIHTAAPEGALSMRLDYIRRLASPAPYAVTKFTHPKVQRSVVKSLTGNQFDVAVCDFLSASMNFPDHPKTPRVLFQHNVETVLWQRMAETETAFWRKRSYKIEAAKMARYEKNALARFPRIIAVSNRDRDEMLKMHPTSRITVVPTGVDTELYRVALSSAGDPPIIVFTGSMDWEPNIDAVEYFCRQIWPAVLAEFPNALFQIVGRNPHPRVQRLANHSIQVTGKVASVADYLSPATVVIVPLRIGGGTRLKIFEAMAMGKALVSTSIGAEGLDVTPNRDLFLADTPEIFASSILNLLRQPDLRHNCERNAAIVAARYDWSKIASAFAAVLQEAIADFDRPH
jgi:glycosyltransferase involved in cell wall biosynthesis